MGKRTPMGPRSGKTKGYRAGGMISPPVMGTVTSLEPESKGVFHPKTSFRQPKPPRFPAQEGETHSIPTNSKFNMSLAPGEEKY